MSKKKDKKDNAVYKQLSNDMRDGLKDIYMQLTTASGSNKKISSDALFHEATDQLDEVLKTTEQAAMNIMEIVEKMLDLHDESSAIVAAVKSGEASDGQKERLGEIHEQIGADLSNILTAMSFQDITGQRIKKAMTAMSKIEKSVVELYVQSGLVMEEAEKDPEKDVDAVKDAAAKAVEDFRNNRKVTSELKGPSTDGISQGAIDDMLAQLGL